MSVGGHLSRMKLNDAWYDIQTEITGHDVSTQVFCAGAIVETVRGACPPDCSPDDVRALAKRQHQEVCRDLVQRN